MNKTTVGFRVFFAFLVSCGIAAGVLLNSYGVSGTSAHSGSITDDPKDVPSISARERGNPYMNFEDGRTIPLPEGAAAGSPARSMAKGDVDSDGTPDLIVADSGGAIHVYRGNPDSIFPNSAAAQKRRESNTFTEDPFIYSHIAAIIPTAPDVLESGDFNADGHIDIVAARFGESSIFFAAGDGKGNFAPAMRIDVGGAVTALFAGEIGRPDEQTDLAVAVASPDGPRILVFEHPEGALKNPAEMYVLPAQATTIAAGNLDSDSYRDLAIGSGNILTIIRGRGHTYPWDKLKEVQLERPRPLVESKQMPFEIASMVVGRFGNDNAEVLAFVTASGAIETLSRPAKRAEAKKPARPAKALEQYIPVGARAMRLATMEYAIDQENMIRKSDIKRGAELVSNINDRSASEEFTPNKSENDVAVSFTTQRARDGFIKSISPSVEEPLLRWQTREVFRDARLAQAAVFGGAAMRAVRVHISDSGRDELAVLDRVGSQIHLFRRGAVYANGTRSTDEVVTFDSNAVPIDLLPMRLNRDALSDLIILHEGSTVPSVAMTAPMATYVVTTNDDVSGCGSEICSLRGAISQANNNPGPDLITFSIGSGPQTIVLNTQLPDLRSAATLDATTQPGFVSSPLIEVAGHNIANRSDGLQISGSNSVIRGFVVNRFKGEYDASMGGIVGGNGIAVFTTLGSSTSINNFVEGNYSGTNLAGTSDLGNDTTGVNIFDADETTVGGTSDDARNVLSGNGSDNDPDILPRKFGAGAAVFGGQYNVFKGNYIGTNAAGSGRINNSIGIRMAGGNTLVGGNEAGAGNVISGNGDRFTVYNPDGCIGPGVEEETVYDPNTLEFLTVFNDYRGNKIGTDAAGTAAVGNCSTGIRTNPSHMSSIGSIVSSGRNIISGNLENALYCSPMPRGFGIVQGPVPPAGYCSIAGNNIGTDITGNLAIPNRDYNNYDFFILFFGTVAVFNSDTLSNVGGPGGTSAGQCQGHCNLISGNETEAVFRGSALGEVAIFNNFLGTNRSGTSALGNDTGFRSFENGITYVGGVGINNAHGGDGGLIPLGNLISGNLYNGITMDSTPPRSFLPKYIQNNRIGTDAGGTNAIPNSTASGFGLLIVNEAVLIGGSNPMHRNIISGNAFDGIVMSGSIGNPIIANNYIGVGSTGQPLGNGQDGIRINASGVTVGYDADTGNVIANNGRVGVFVSARTNAPGPSQRNRFNPIRFNSIFNNGALGIDLSVGTGFVVPPDGVTPNDCFDTDIFANERQNYPDLSTPVFNGNGTVSVEGVLRSEQERTYVIDFYASSTADPTNYGEGETYIGSTTVTTDLFYGTATFNFTSTATVAPGSKITATATDPDGNTSEFSCVAGECSATDCVVPIVVNVTNDLPDNSPANGICDVDLSTPGLQCSLRGAIQTAQAMTGPKVIHFAIPGGGPHTITLGSELPTITKPIQFAGNTQPGFTGTPLIQVTGNGVRNNCLNLGVGSNASEVKGLSLTRCQVGLNIQSNNTQVESSYFGVTPAGAPAGALGDQTKGIRVAGTGNRIGSTAGNGNVLGNNGTAISLESGSGNAVLGNWIGVPESPGPATPNNIGIKIQNSTANQIGNGSGPGLNAVANNVNADIDIGAGAVGNDLNMNLIGLSFIGGGSPTTYARQTGVAIGSGAAENVVRSNIIGGYTQTAAAVGVRIKPDAGAANDIRQNFIGLVPETLTNIGNSYGVAIFADGQNIENNTIGFSAESGIFAAPEAESSNPVVNGNTINQNKIGVSTEGESFPNAKFGIHLTGSANANAVDQNIVANSGVAGIALTEGPDGNTVEGNFVGLTVDTTEFSNPIGIWLRNASNNEVHDNEVDNNPIGILLGTDIGFGDTNPAALTTEFLVNREGTSPTETTGNQLGGNFVAGGTIGIAIGDDTVGNTVGPPSRSFNVITKVTDAVGGIGLLVGTVNAATTPQRFSRQNTVQRTMLGFNPRNLAISGNRVGMKISGAFQNIIGGATEENAVFICGSSQDGLVAADRTTENTIRINKIGVAPNGIPAGNGGNGILIESGSTDTVIEGGDSEPQPPPPGNTVPSGVAVVNNAAKGISIMSGSVGAKIKKAFVSANLSDGIVVGNAPGTEIGGAIATAKNVIGNNNGHGVKVSGVTVPATNALAVKIMRNAIGAFGESLTGSIQNIGNSLSGVMIENSVGVVVGTSAGGMLSGFNGQNGVTIDSDSTDITVENSTILENEGDGILVGNAPGTQIGGTSDATANTIGRNKLNGLRFMDVSGPFSPERFAKALRNKIGTFIDPKTGEPVNIANIQSGIRIQNSNRVRIGTEDGGPLVGFNGQTGVRIDSGSSEIKVENSTVIGNFGDGILVGNAPGTQIGGETGTTTNIIGNNGGHGIKVVGAGTSGNPEQSVKIVRNSIGAVIDQISGITQNIGNIFSGIRIENSIGVRVGNDAGGVVSGFNGESGISIVNGSSEVEVVNSTITSNDGDGIEIIDSSDNVIGSPGKGNSLIRNAANAIKIISAMSQNNKIESNDIGTEPNAPLLERKRLRGSTLGNGGNGILIVDAPNTRIGSATPGTGNRIFDNDLSGIKITASTGQFPAGAQVFVTGNEISFNAHDGISNVSRHEALHVLQNNRVEANNGKGIDLDESNNNSVTQNFVAVNGEEGVVLAGPATRLNNVRGNIIAENVSHGVNIDNGANTNNVGGPNSGQGNTIRNNGGAGINLTPTAGSGNNLDPNSIFGNVGLGIDLGGDGFTINDPLDADEGPNRLQNYPTIMSSQISNNELVVSYFMDSLPGNSNYGTDGIYIEFFKADINGEGEIFLGSTYYTEADYNGLAPTVKSVNLGDIDVLGYTPTDRVTSTATDADGNTSEFSPTLGPTSAGVSVSGRVLTAAGVAIRGTTVTMTDDNGVVRTAVTSSLGYYAFEGIAAGRTYVVTAVSRRYRFTPRIVSVADPISDLDLIALE
ncbi:MAG: right-handed parallel beta-helix repeat-containing protein [Acidobacteria bacterium]|nr:right-handed parallel beta-helix repeat-containing protein [Acidobacteriota bacterium]